MAKQTINIGSAANDGSGDPLRTAFDKINDNFNELYAATSEGAGQNIAISGNKLISENTNGDIELEPDGTGTVDFDIPTQTSVGAAGAGSALPATPTGYIKIKISGVDYVIPYYAQS
jgi:hypothetical protein